MDKKDFIYDKPELVEIRLGNFSAQGALGDPPFGGSEGSGGLTPAPPGDNPFA